MLESAKLWRQPFWMRSYSNQNCKRTKIWSTARAVWRLNLGKLKVTKGAKAAAPTCRKYLNHKGEVRFTATKQLKLTQRLAYFWFMSLFRAPTFNPKRSPPRQYPPSFCSKILALRSSLMRSRPELPAESWQQIEGGCLI